VQNLQLLNNMKNLIKVVGICMVFLVGLLIPVDAIGDENIVFLHHSIGGNLYNYPNNGIEQYFVEHNVFENTSYSIDEWEYPGERDYTPYPWNNYPWDYWNLWINPNTPCNSDVCSGEGYRCMECIDPIINQYDVVVLKHCYAGSDILENTGNANVMFSTKSIENYELQYAALRDLFDSYPNTLFIVFTLPPRDKDSTSADIGNAARATQFSEWTKNNWLNNGNPHNNIVVFDIREYLVEKDSDSDYFNFLKEEYVNVAGDSHPNDRANNFVGPIFGEFLINETQNFFGIPSQENLVCSDGTCNGNETCLTCPQDCGPCEVHQNITIESGWNVISVNISTNLLSSELGPNLVLSYGESGWERFSGVLEPLKAYYVYSVFSGDVIHTFDGISLSPGYKYELIQENWNLFSVSSSETFDELYPDVDETFGLYEVYEFDGDLNFSELDASSDILQPGHYYWVDTGSSLGSPFSYRGGIVGVILEVIKYFKNLI